MIFRNGKTEQCLNCRFYPNKELIRSNIADNSLSSPPTVGFCKKHAPVTAQGLYGVSAQWPIVHEDDGCGDYEWRLSL